MARHNEVKYNKWGVHGAVLIVCLVALPLLILFFWQHDVKITVEKGLNYGSNETSTPSNNNYLHGLIPSNFDKESCLSRYEWPLFRKSFPYMPSSYLLHKLRNYEDLHKKCGPNTPLYQKSIQQLNSGHSSIEPMECNYVVWIPHNGLGNRILTLASTFLYAILTNRVMLIQMNDELVDLFCEPFPDTSWILPPDFPIKNLNEFDVNSNVTYGNMLDKHVIISNHSINTEVESLPSYVYVHLVYDYHALDRLFFCNDDQIVLRKVNWLLLKSDQYFIPSFYSSTPMFEEKLDRLFPAKESVFYLLAHYLIHPSNNVWGLVRRYYMSYLAKADEKIGIQVRVFFFTKVSSDVIFQQIQNCSKVESVLPELDFNGTKAFKPDEQNPSKAILVASLYSYYYEKLKSMYYEHSVKTGELVSVYQPSHEEQQKTKNQSHNKKALAEMYLLSLCDMLMTSGWSTFGYASSGLAGIKPVILMTIRNKNIPDMPCVREASMEPCYIFPAKPSCKGKTVDKEKLQQYVKQCPDFDHGIKLFD
ncbi:galactoside 2-alpha-L-fucosyltransferase-like protein [Carex littledalei]|uniref:Fucosyltransferase n=1 Tax=Carex littledalei TaxID=544730 RepID=A0A833RB78_9POAL|nr:galactoside 2-alpha-L-fucosyltransferase-like protein [Carex littledalei]